jgi:hypothetical protein
MADLEELGRESVETIYMALIDKPQDYSGSTFNKRDMLARSYKEELTASLSACQSDECIEEEYKSFSKRHRIELPGTPDEAEELVRNKLGEYEPWLINDIYQKRMSKLGHILIPPDLR